MNRPEIAHCVASAPLYDSGYIILPNFNVILQYAFRGSPGALEAHKTADHTMTLRLTGLPNDIRTICRQDSAMLPTRRPDKRPTNPTINQQS